MKLKSLLAAILLALPLRAADLSLTSGQRLVFLGDSLLYHAGFPSYGDYMASYLYLRNPTLALQINQAGRSGLAIASCFDSSTVLYQHYRKYVAPLAPDYVFSMFADNGGYDKATFKTHTETLITDYIVGIDTATPILLGMIPQSDVDGYGNGTLYDDAIQEIAEAATPDWPYSKLWQTLTTEWQVYQAMTGDSATDVLTSTAHGFSDGERIIFQGGTPPTGLSAETYYYCRDTAANTFKLSTTAGGGAIDLTSNGSGTINVSANWAKLRGTTAADEIHPSTAGSIIAAWKLITGLGWGTDVSAATINGSAATLTSSTDCTVASITTNAYGGIDFTRLDARLPWAIDEEHSGTGRAEALAIYPAMAGWQAYTLTVTGLTAGTYDVYIDGDAVASVTHTALAAGWNMADLTTGPVWDKCQATLNAIRDLQGVNQTTLIEITSPARVGWRKYVSNANSSYEGGNDGAAGAAAHLAALSTNLTELETLADAIHTAAQPATLSFSLRLQGYAPGGGGGSVEAGTLNTTTLNVIP